MVAMGEDFLDSSGWLKRERWLRDEDVNKLLAKFEQYSNKQRKRKAKS
jgi:hypothetical protein